MSCGEWEERIAGDLEDPAAVLHAAECVACGEFASGLQRTLAELRAAHAEEIGEAHYAAVRARVAGKLRRRAAWSWVWAGATVAVGLAVAAGVWEGMRVEELRIEAAAPVIPGVELRASRMPARMPGWRAGGSLHEQREEIVVKIETGNPDVVIYWIAEAKGDE